MGDLGSIPGSGGSPGEGNGKPLQYSALEKPRDRGALQAMVHRATKSGTRLSSFLFLSLSFFLPFRTQGLKSFFPVYSGILVLISMAFSQILTDGFID